MPHECTDCGRAFEDGSKEMLSGCPNCGGTTFQFRPAGSEPSGGSDEPPDRTGPDVDGVTRTVGNAASAVRNLVAGEQAAGPPEADELGSEVDGEAGEREETDASVEATQTPADGESAATDEEVTIPSTPDWPGTDDTEPDDGQQVTATPQEETAQSETRGEIVEADEIPSATDRPSDQPPVPDPRPLSVRAAESDESATEDADDGVTADDPDDRPSLSELRAELNDQFESIRVVEPGQYELNLMELYDREEYIIALQEDGKYTIQLPERWEKR